MGEFQLALSKDEKELLVEVLTGVLGETRVEAHHTRSPAYKERVLHQESLVRDLLTKLGHAPKGP